MDKKMVVGLGHIVSEDLTNGGKLIFNDINSAKECAKELSQACGGIFNVYQHIGFAYEGELGEPTNLRELVKNACKS